MDHPNDSSKSPSPRSESARSSSVKPILIVCFVGLCFSLLVYSPGYMSWDSLDQLLQARSGVFKDNHPPLMAAIWSVVDDVCAGPFGMLLLQTMMFWGGLALFFVHIKGPVFLRAAAAIAIGLYPPIFGLIGTIWKDILMLSALMMVLGIAVRFEKHRGVLSTIVLIVCVLIACGVRHNAIIALPPIFVWMAHALQFVRRKPPWPKFRRAFGVACAASLLLYFVNGVISKNLTKDRTCLWQCMAVFDVAGVSVQVDQLLFPEDLILTKSKLKLGYLENAFQSGTVGAIYREPRGRSAILQNRFKQVQDEERLDRLSSLWKNVIIKHPIAYLKHRWRFYAHLIGWTGKVDTPIYGLYGPRIAENDLGLVFHTSRLNEIITSWLVWLSETWVYRVWIYLILLVVLTVVSTREYVKHGDPLPLALSSSGLLYDAAYFFLAASSNFRYSLWAILAALLCTAYLACKYLQRPDVVPAATS